MAAAPPHSDDKALVNDPRTIAKLRLYEAMAAIPQGKVVSYGQLAELAGQPRSARWAGRCLRNLPKDSTLPWYRVITASGKLAFTPNSEAYWRQRNLLENEQVLVQNHKVNMRMFRWQP